MEMQPNKIFYADANSTLRVTYGKVRGYSPNDGVYFRHYTTLNGIMEKVLLEFPMQSFDVVIPKWMQSLPADNPVVLEMIEKVKNSPVGEYIYAIDAENIEKITVEALKDRGLTLCVAESCTGGLIAKRITDIAGCSDVFLGGCVTYANEAKEKLIGVGHETLEKYGAVSEQTAREMARGVRLATGSDIGVSATGIAGPTGGTPETPVGTVFIGISTKDFEDCRRLSLSPMRSREYIRLASATNAFDMVLKVIKRS